MGVIPSIEDVHPDFKAVIFHKGIQNLVGQNNCFLNVVIQVLWHVDGFRITLQKMFYTSGFEVSEMRQFLKGTKDHSGLTLFKAVCLLFLDYEDETFHDVLNPNGVREVLAVISSKFQFGEIADSNETLDEILKQFHQEDERCGVETNYRCLAHRIFGGTLVNMFECSTCGNTSEPEFPENFLHYAYAAELLDVAYSTAALSSSGNRQNERSLGRLLQQCRSLSSARCPTTTCCDTHSLSTESVCPGDAVMKTFCLTPPMCFCLAVAWTSPHESPDTLRRFMQIVTPTMTLSEVFCADGPDSSNIYQFRGFICYYGQHYVSIFKDTRSYEVVRGEAPQFVLLDDAKMRILGTWNQVIEEVVKSRYQPVLLLYEHSLPISDSIIENTMNSSRMSEEYSTEVNLTDIHNIEDDDEDKYILANRFDYHDNNINHNEQFDAKHDFLVAKEVEATASYGQTVSSRNNVLECKESISSSQKKTRTPSSESKGLNRVVGEKRMIEKTEKQDTKEVEDDDEFNYSFLSPAPSKHPLFSSSESNKKSSTRNRPFSGSPVTDLTSSGDCGGGGGDDDDGGTRSAAESKTFMELQEQALREVQLTVSPICMRANPSYALARSRSVRASPLNTTSKNKGFDMPLDSPSKSVDEVLAALTSAYISEHRPSSLTSSLRSSSKRLLKHSSSRGVATDASSKQIEAKQCDEDKKSDESPLLYVDSWGRTLKSYRVRLDLPGKGQHGIVCEQSGRDFVVIALVRSTRGEILPGEACKTIDLMDKIISINGKHCMRITLREAKELLDEAALFIDMELESSHLKSLWYDCPYCTMRNNLTDSEQNTLEEYAKVCCKTCKKFSVWESLIGDIHTDNDNDEFDF